MEETAHKPKIIPSSQADPALSPRNQIMLSSTNLWCISKLISRFTYSELMMQGIGVSGGHIPTISISDSCTITILAQYRYSLYKSIYKFSAAFVFFSSLSTFFFLNFTSSNCILSQVSYFTWPARFLQTMIKLRHLKKPFFIKIAETVCPLNC